MKQFYRCLDNLIKYLHQQRMTDNSSQLLVNKMSCALSTSFVSCNTLCHSPKYTNMVVRITVCVYHRHTCYKYYFVGRISSFNLAWADAYSACPFPLTAAEIFNLHTGPASDCHYLTMVRCLINCRRIRREHTILFLLCKHLYQPHSVSHQACWSKLGFISLSPLSCLPCPPPCHNEVYVWVAY